MAQPRRIVGGSFKTASLSQCLVGTTSNHIRCNGRVYTFIYDLADAMKGATTVRISGPAHQKLRELAEEDGVSLTEELDHVVEAQRRRRFIEKANRAYAAIKSDEEKWAAYQKEINELEGTLMDGLEDEPPYFEEKEEEDGS